MKIKQWFFENSSQGIIVFTIFMLCTFPIALGGAITQGRTQHTISPDTQLQKDIRYRSPVLLFKENNKTYYFNCDL